MNTELTKENLKNIYGTVSPFEFKDKLLKLAKPLMKTEYGQYLVKIANENQNNEYLNETDVVAEGMI